MLSTTIDVLGAALVVAGVAFIFWPAALIVAGGFVLLASWRSEL